MNIAIIAVKNMDINVVVIFEMCLKMKAFKENDIAIVSMLNKTSCTSFYSAR